MKKIGLRLFFGFAQLWLLSFLVPLFYILSGGHLASLGSFFPSLEVIVLYLILVAIGFLRWKFCSLDTLETALEFAGRSALLVCVIVPVSFLALHGYEYNSAGGGNMIDLIGTYLRHTVQGTLVYVSFFGYKANSLVNSKA